MLPQSCHHRLSGPYPLHQWPPSAPGKVGMGGSRNGWQLLAWCSTRSISFPQKFCDGIGEFLRRVTVMASNQILKLFREALEFLLHRPNARRGQGGPAWKIKRLCSNFFQGKGRWDFPQEVDIRLCTQSRPDCGWVEVVPPVTRFSSRSPIRWDNGRVVGRLDERPLFGRRVGFSNAQVCGKIAKIPLVH